MAASRARHACLPAGNTASRVTRETRIRSVAPSGIRPLTRGGAGRYVSARRGGRRRPANRRLATQRDNNNKSKHGSNHVGKEI